MAETEVTGESEVLLEENASCTKRKVFESCRIKEGTGQI